MNPVSPHLEELQNRDRELKARLAQVGEMRPGSLVERYRKCGKPNCHCARPGDRGHGPLWMVTHAVEGKTVSKAIPCGPAVDRTRSQIAEHQRFRELARELVATNEQICDARLEESTGLSSSDNKKTALAERLAVEVEQEIEALLGTAVVEELDLEAVETALRRRALRVAARLLEGRLNADRSDQSGASRPCACGQKARYAGRRAKRFQSVLGELNLERAYYHYPACGQGCCPRDQVLRLEGASLSPGVQRRVGSVGAAVSFEEGSALLRELADVEVDAKQVERVAEELGAEIAEQEQHNPEPRSDLPSAPTLYLGREGTEVPMRSTELRGRAGKQPDGSAKTREVKLCTVWSAESRDAEGWPVRDEGSVSYSAAIESAATRDPDRELSEFTPRVEREATRRRCRDAPHLVVIGDGAAWIWNLAHELFPPATQVVDRFHVKERLSQVAQSVYGESSEEAKRWAQRRHQELDEGRWRNLRAALLRHALHSKAARDCLHYLRRNRQRMRLYLGFAFGFVFGFGL